MESMARDMRHPIYQVLPCLLILVIVTGHFPVVPLHLEWGDAVGTHMHHATYMYIPGSEIKGKKQVATLATNS